jgi:hypothetical protein
LYIFFFLTVNLNKHASNKNKLRSSIEILKFLIKDEYEIYNKKIREFYLKPQLNNILLYSNQHLNDDK